MAYIDRCKNHCKDNLKNAEVTYQFKDPHGKTTTHFKCICGHTWREN